MNKFFTFALVLLCAHFSFGQNKLEKIKGSKIVTVTTKDLEHFQTVEVENFLEVYFVKSAAPSLEIEADDNLHDVLEVTQTGKILKLKATKIPTGEKKFSIRVNYTDSLNTIVGRQESKLNALADINLEKISIKNFDKSQSFLNVKATHFYLQLSDDSKAEINSKSQFVTIELTKDAKLSALINASDTKIDMYQSANAEIEGDSEKAKFRLDNTANLKAKKFTTKEAKITTEASSKAVVNAQKTIEIEASGKSEIDLLGEPKIDLKKFTNSAVLTKKEK